MYRHQRTDIFVLKVAQHKLLSDTEGNSHQHQSKEETIDSRTDPQLDKGSNEGLSAQTWVAQHGSSISYMQLALIGILS